MNSLRLRIAEYSKGILSGDRLILARAITLVESALPSDQFLAEEVLDAVISSTGNSLRIGITGAPGVGKSTFIEAFGRLVTDAGKKIAVLTIDPTSQLTRGSILGDKTRMEALSKNPMAFIRSSASGITLGGVATHTREAMLLCEAAGFEVIVVETVGTGQSETAVKSMVDFFLLLMLAGSGDELQGIKKGIVEMADAIAITKTDGENINLAISAQHDFQQALHLQRSHNSGWIPKVVTCSALDCRGLSEIFSMVQEFKQQLINTGYFQSNRQQQHALWFKEHFNYLLSMDSQHFPEVNVAENELECRVQSEKISPRKAAQQLLKIYHQAVSDSLKSGG